MVNVSRRKRSGTEIVEIYYRKNEHPLRQKEAEQTAKTLREKGPQRSNAESLRICRCRELVKNMNSVKPGLIEK